MLDGPINSYGAVHLKSQYLLQTSAVSSFLDHSIWLGNIFKRSDLQLLHWLFIWTKKIIKHNHRQGLELACTILCIYSWPGWVSRVQSELFHLWCRRVDKTDKSLFPSLPLASQETVIKAVAINDGRKVEGHGEEGKRGPPRCTWKWEPPHLIYANQIRHPDSMPLGEAWRWQ